ncbi:MAG: hypothetical protein SH847_15625 [Roseiflexaceae bacterium]|nr:hypothetical protein [Roseiflexaceae bacterium]
MQQAERNGSLADLADGLVGGPEWDVWLAQNPDAAAEIELSRRVRLLLGAMREAEIQMPEGFEARLMVRLREDKTLLDLIDFGVSGIARAVLELITAIFSFLPSPAQPTPV